MLKQAKQSLSTKNPWFIVNETAILVFFINLFYMTRNSESLIQILSSWQIVPPKISMYMYNHTLPININKTKSLKATHVRALNMLNCNRHAIHINV